MPAGRATGLKDAAGAGYLAEEEYWRQLRNMPDTVLKMSLLSRIELGRPCAITNGEIDVSQIVSAQGGVAVFDRQRGLRHPQGRDSARPDSAGSPAAREFKGQRWDADKSVWK
jgi:hypothetical protein